MSEETLPRRVEPEYLEDLTQPTLYTLGLIGLFAGWLWLIVRATLVPYMPIPAIRLRPILPSIVLVIVSAICLLPQRPGSRWQRGFFVVGLALTFLLCYIWLPTAIWYYYPALVVVVAGMLWGAWGACVTAVGLTAALLGLREVSPGQPPLTTLWPAIGFLWTATVISWVSWRNLYTALGWAYSSQKRAAHLLTELREHQGQLNRTLVALTEATRRLERTNHELAIARRQAEEARAMKEHFVANVSHELRTPLNLIVGFSEMLYLEPDNYEGAVWTNDLLSDVGEMYRASRHLQSLVNDILDLSRIDAAKLPMFRELLDLRVIITEAIDTIAPLLRERGLECKTAFPEALPQVFVDRTRLRQVMLNLLNNAARFTDQGGITVRVEQAEDVVRVGVEDTGLGIPPDKLEAIFEEFQQVDTSPSRRGGAGLGLSLSRQFVELHGGRMWAASELGKGSTFTFALPLPGATPQTTALVRPREAAPIELDLAPVVLVDPDPTIAVMLGRYLGDRRILSVGDPAQAEALIEAEHPAGVIVNLPPDVPREEWLGAVGAQAERYSVPVVRCSIPSATWLRESTGLDECLTKPVSRETLEPVVARYAGMEGSILVVDDYPGFASLMTRMLGAMGHVGPLLTAYTGAEGLRLAQEAKPNLIFLDLLLPDIDGFQVLAALRADESLKEVPVVAVTATSYAEEALMRYSGHFTITRANGLTTGTLTELLAAAFHIVRPNYVVEESTPLSA